MFLSSKSLKTRQRGFSLIEVLTAMFVIVVGLSGVTATLWWGSQQSDGGKVIAEASNLGRVCMETLIVRGSFITGADVNDGANVRKNLSAPPLALTDFTTIGLTVAGDHRNISSNIERFKRNISMERLSNNTNRYDFPLCRATVRIYWKDKNNHERFVAQETITPWRSPPPISSGTGSGGAP